MIRRCRRRPPARTTEFENGERGGARDSPAVGGGCGGEERFATKKSRLVGFAWGTVPAAGRTPLKKKNQVTIFVDVEQDDDDDDEREREHIVGSLATKGLLCFGC
jgi:hypothetical protein